MKGLAIRPSQFTLSYGVGSIIEASGGPRIISDFQNWGRVFISGRKPSVEYFEIHDIVTSQLLNGGRIFRLPTNLDLDIPDSIPIFKTIPFPQWALCEQHNKLFVIGSNDRTQCQQCIDDGNVNSARKQSIRFVRACSDGHLDDVDWQGILHENNNPCSSIIFEWESRTGSSLRNVTIRCLECGQSIRLTDIYAKTIKCSGKIPESAHSKIAACSKKAQVVLRGSSSLRIPEIITTVAIPTRNSPLDNLLSKTLIKGVIMGEGDWTKDKLLMKMTYMREKTKVISPEDVEIVRNSEEGQITKAIHDLERRMIENDLTLDQVKLEEFHELETASQFGYPSDPCDSNPSFQINKHKVRSGVKFGPFELRIAPIENLRIMIVQKGYRRLGTDPLKNKLVETYYYDGNDRWYAGMEQFGEGIFIDIPNGIPVNDGSWNKFYASESSIFFHPQFVWWHTLSHRIINALSVDSGYSSASIRERIYGEIDDKTGNFSGGILLYATQPGGDGSLGGLISLVSIFERVMKSALKNLNYCSNDPLCSEQKPSATVNNGAACYACTLLSETSCELRNMFLDRNVLRGSL